MNRHLLTSILCALAVCSASADGQVSRSTEAPSVGEWPLETIQTTEGRTYRGYIQSEEGDELEFVEVVRPRGKPMHLVVRPFAGDLIRTRVKLPEKERNELARRIYQFRNRARIEAGRMEDIELIDVEEKGRVWQTYQGPWFEVRSSADPETTRRAIVRTEQIFRAYRQIIPPRLEPSRELHFLLLGSMDEYRSWLASQDLQIANPAVYSQQLNVIVAGCELTRFGQRLRSTREHHNRLREQYEVQDRNMPLRLAQLRSELKAAGVNQRIIEKEIDARRSLWDEEKKNVTLKLAAADRRNDARFADLTQQMFRRLGHEGLHAYLENYVYPHQQHQVPPWLHEGLALVFESGRLEAGMLRIDAPARGPLKNLQAQMKSGDEVPLAFLLKAKRHQFFETQGQLYSADQLYGASWALAYYLMFENPILGSTRLDRFVAQQRADSDPIQEFESLTQVPLSELEHRWRSYFQSMAP